MASDESIVELAQWLRTPVGRYLLAWEQRQFDAVVADVFGFHALQLGWPELDALAANRMPGRWRASEHSRSLPLIKAVPSDKSQPKVALRCDFEALPFPNASLDLVVLPHALELAQDPHVALREVERVLVPEGRVVIAGFNPASLWGLRQRMGQLRRRLGIKPNKGLFLPRAGEFIGYWRLRDWLRLLSFEVEGGRFGCYRPPMGSERWLTRFGWFESAGDRWWPVFGAVYFIVAVKRVRGMRLVGLAKTMRAKPKAAPAVATHHRHEHLD